MVKEAAPMNSSFAIVSIKNNNLNRGGERERKRGRGERGTGERGREERERGRYLTLVKDEEGANVIEIALRLPNLFVKRVIPLII